MAQNKKALVSRETVPCKWCGIDTPNWGTQECDFCWEMHKRIERKPDIAAHMLDVVLEKKGAMNGKG